MIENLRKYTGLMLVALVAVFVGLILFVDTGLTRGRGTGTPFMRIDGRTYSYDEYTLLGERSLQMANDLRMNMMVGQLAGSPWQPDPKKFFIHRMLLRQAQDDFGVHPSEADVLAYLRERSSFVNEGKFNQEAYGSYVSQRIGRYGLGEKNLHELVRDYLAYEKLAGLVGGGLLGDFEFNRRAYADQNQKLDLGLIEFPIAKYEGKVEPADEEIRTFWEENQEDYSTTLRRRFTYVTPMPEVAAPAAKPEAEAAADPQPADATATAGTKDEAAAKEKEAKDNKDKEQEEATAKARQEAERKLAGSVDTFLGEIENSDGGEFEKICKEYGWELKTTEMFTAADLPQDLNRTIRNSQPGRTMAFYLFDNLTVTADPVSKFTSAIPIADGAWVIARLDQEEPVRTKTFEEARAEARADLIRQRAVEAMKKEADDAAASLREQVKGGKEFAVAAKEAGLEVRSFSGFGANDKPDGMTEPRTIFEAAARVDPGTFAEVLHQADRSLVVFVVKREVVREENLRGRVEAFATQDTNRNNFIAFDAWLAAGRERSKMLVPQG